MSRLKTHYGDTVNEVTITACGRGGRMTKTVRYVDCRACQNTQEFQTAKDADDAARKAAFEAQTPRQFAEPWHTQTDRALIIRCRNCDGTLFRQADRSCYGHYDNYVCANCGETTQRLTETGMSF